MPDVREVYEMVTKQKAPEPGALERQQRRQVRTARNRKYGALAVVAAIGIAAIVAIFATGIVGDRSTPGGQPTTSAKRPPVDVARRFVEGIAAFDTDAALVKMASGADMSALVGSLGTPNVSGSVSEFGNFISLLEAQQLELILGSCEERDTSGSSTRVRCTFAFHLLGSHDLGFGPYRGSALDATVADGSIVSASMNWETGEFSREMWEPFAEWVSTNHPEDVTVMYADETQGGANLTHLSIQLWRVHLQEYVEEAR